MARAEPRPAGRGPHLVDGIRCPHPHARIVGDEVADPCVQVGGHDVDCRSLLPGRRSPGTELGRPGIAQGTGDFGRKSGVAGSGGCQGCGGSLEELCCAVDEFELPFTPIEGGSRRPQGLGMNVVVGKVGQVLTARPIKPVGGAPRAQPGDGHECVAADENLQMVGQFFRNSLRLAQRRMDLLPLVRSGGKLEVPALIRSARAAPQGHAPCSEGQGRGIEVHSLKLIRHRLRDVVHTLDFLQLRQRRGGPGVVLLFRFKFSRWCPWRSGLPTGRAFARQRTRGPVDDRHGGPPLLAPLEHGLGSAAGRVRRCLGPVRPARF